MEGADLLPEVVAEEPKDWRFDTLEELLNL